MPPRWKTTVAPVERGAEGPSDGHMVESFMVGNIRILFYLPIRHMAQSKKVFRSIRDAVRDDVRKGIELAKQTHRNGTAWSIEVRDRDDPPPAKSQPQPLMTLGEEDQVARWTRLDDEG